MDSYNVILSIGPVQGFINAGRRTRDYWAGSFLLSRLIGEIMVSLIENGATINLPSIYDENNDLNERTLIAIRNARNTKNNESTGPMLGTLVNHFEATIKASDLKQAQQQIMDATDSAKAVFSRLQKQVFKVFIAPVLTELSKDKKSDIKKRWKLQTNGNFFEILWVLTEGKKSQSLPQLLAQRKASRVHPPLIEPSRGDRCPIHSELCELGGFTRQFERKQQDNFWKLLRKRVVEVMYGSQESHYIETLEIGENEHLSALALVKRLFPLLEPTKIAEVIGWIPNHTWSQDESSTGDKEVQYTLRNWPSTAFIAAVPFIVKAYNIDSEACDCYANKQLKSLDAGKKYEAERPQHHRIADIDSLKDNNNKIPIFATLDGNLFFQRGVDKYHRDLKNDAIVSNYSDLIRDVELSSPSTQYALLEMDGDNMGKLMSDEKISSSDLSRALLSFSNDVHAIVRKLNGVVLFAGADDVKAMLPIETAIEAAIAINNLWHTTMKKCTKLKPPLLPTISGSIVFADYQQPLSDVMSYCHSQLDEIAKNQAGRNALAISIYKSSGVTAQWVSRWHDNKDNNKAKELQEFAQEWSQSKQLASRLPYIIKDRFSSILEAKINTNEQSSDTELFNDKKLTQLFSKEMGDSGYSESNNNNRAKAEKVVQVLRPFKSNAEGVAIAADRHIGALLIARFLKANCLWDSNEVALTKNEIAGEKTE